MSDAKVYRVVVSYDNYARKPQTYSTDDAVIDGGSNGSKPHFLDGATRFSFASDDLETSYAEVGAAGFVLALRKARAARVAGKFVSVKIISGDYYAPTVQHVMTCDARFQSVAPVISSDAAKFIVAYLMLGDENALLVLSDMLEEKLGLPIAVGGVLADVHAAEQKAAAEAEAAAKAAAQRKRHPRPQMGWTRLTSGRR